MEYGDWPGAGKGLLLQGNVFAVTWEGSGKAVKAHRGVLCRDGPCFAHLLKPAKLARRWQRTAAAGHRVRSDLGKQWQSGTGNRQCRAHGLQNARISCGEVNVRSRAYPLNTSDLWRFWRTFLEFCCGAYVFRYQRLLRGFALLLFGSSGAIGNSCRVELVGCLPFPSPMGLSSGWKALRVQQG